MPEILLCKDCHWCDRAGFVGADAWLCTSPRLGAPQVSLISGDMQKPKVFCGVARVTGCGPAGQWFKPKVEVTS